MPFKHQFALDINKTVKAHPNAKGKREKVGSANVPCPTLDDFGIQAKQALDEKTNQPAFENGLPVYDDVRMQWLMDAIQSAVAVRSRNKFDVNSGKLKPGMELAGDFEALTAESARTGEALILRREARASFENFLRKLNKKEPIVAMLSELFWNSSKVLGTVSPKYLEAITHYSTRWIQEELDEAQQNRFLPKITELQESITNASSEDDLMEGEETGEVA